MKLTTAILAMLIIMVSGCKKECEIRSCGVGGLFDNTNCKCKCFQNYSGENCETYTPPCNDRGTVVVYSGKSDPYQVKINGSYQGNVGAYGSATFNGIKSGFVTIEVTQASGYIFYPSVYSGSGSLYSCGTLNWSF